MPGRYRERPYVPAKDPLAAIPPSRHPFQVWMMFALVLSGFGNLVTPGSEILREGLDPFFHKLWAANMLVAGVLALLAAWWPDRITGLLMERISMITLATTCPVYGLVVAESRGWIGFAAIMGAFLTASVGGAAAWRAVHINRELRILRRFVARSFR